jgi:hypothetical protein
MDVSFATPLTPPRGRIQGQAWPRWVLRRKSFSDLTKHPLRQESSSRHNVVARSVWETDGKVTVAEVPLKDYASDFHRVEEVRIEGGSWALRVNYVLVGGKLVCHPMAWDAFGDTENIRRQLLDERLPRYRCMNISEPRLLLLSILPGSYPPMRDSVLTLSYEPWFDWRYLQDNFTPAEYSDLWNEWAALVRAERKHEREWAKQQRAKA